MPLAVSLSLSQKRQFIKNGFIILRGAVSAALAKKTLNFIDDAYTKHQFVNKGGSVPGAVEASPVFHPHIRESAEVVDLFLKSGLQDLVEDLMGSSNCVLRGNCGQVAYTRPSEKFLNKGVSMNSCDHMANRWHIDSGFGRFACVGSAFMCLVGVALSEGQHLDENRGQFTVWPGSHMITHPGLRLIIHTSDPEQVMQSFRKQRPDCGMPKRLLLHVGDAFIAHQRLAHAAGINMSGIHRKNVYFRVMHEHQDAILEEYLDSLTPWKGFSGLSGLLPVDETKANVSASQKMYRPFSARPVRALLPTAQADKLQVSDDQALDFLKNGYIVLKDFIPKYMQELAESYVERIYRGGLYHDVEERVRGSDHPEVRFHTTVQRAGEVTDLFYRSGVVDICERFLGQGNVLIRENIASISYRRTSELFLKEGGHATELCPRDGWNITPDENGFRHADNDQSLFVHVVLSEGQDGEENRGHLNVWKGGHFAVQSAFAKLSTKKPSDANSNVGLKLDCGKPLRIMAKPGDVVIGHSRLPIAFGCNLSNKPAISVQFKVVHIDFERLLEKKNGSESPFVGLLLFGETGTGGGCASED